MNYPQAYHDGVSARPPEAAFEIQVARRVKGNGIGVAPTPGQSCAVQHGSLVWISVGHESWAVVDLDDFHLVSGRLWMAKFQANTIYAARNLPRGGGDRGTRAMHQDVLGSIKGEMIDHRYGFGLDNRRKEIRLCTQAQNSRNVSMRPYNKVGLKGVHWCNRMQKYTAQIMVDRKGKHLGYYKTPEEAHAAYCVAANAMHGDFSRIA